MPPLQADQSTGQTNQDSSSYYGGYDSSSSYSGATGSEAGSSQDLAARDRYIQTLVDAINNAAEHGNDFEREKLKAQLDDAKQGRENAYKIAELNNQTQRYGYDQQRQTEIDKLKQDQRQYDSTHALDLKKYGLEVAKAYTQYASTPDQIFAFNDFKSALGQVGQGQAAQSVITSDATPHAKTWQDFAALSGYTAGDTSSTGSTDTSTSDGTTYSASSSGSGSGSQYTTADTSSGGTSDSGGGTDQRQTAISAVTKAMPASDGEGHDQQDYAALDAIKALYFARKPGQVAALGQNRQKTALAGLNRLGYDANQVNEDYQRALPGQRSVRAA